MCFSPAVTCPTLTHPAFHLSDNYTDVKVLQFFLLDTHNPKEFLMT